MTFTLLFRSKKTHFVYNVRRRDVLMLLGALFAFIATAIYHSVNRPNIKLALVDQAQTGIELQRQELKALKLETEQNLTGMVLKIAELQSQMQRINALGSRLVLQSELDQNEFSFDELPAIGGPAQETAINIHENLHVLKSMETMLAELDDKSQQLEALESIMMSRHIDEESYLVGRPIISSGWLSSYFGIRKDPFSGLPAMHKGLDFAGREGDPVVATGAGLVTWAGDRYGYGKLVEIDHGDGLTTRYGHHKDLLVQIGDVVTKGQAIGIMGKTGRATGPHVHYEVLKNGKQTDPLPYVYRKN
jgi:murein DD-endopeptidase MepM/ murein hydrolase activator NlpD